jgi:hypothetical protein
MKSLFSCAGLLVILVGFCASCSRVPAPIKRPAPVIAGGGQADPFSRVLDTFRYPENPRHGDDWTRFREGFNQVQAHFAKPETQARLRLTADERQFLERDAHLSESELAEVESTTFRTPDAHYLDECFLLRDAARNLEINSLETIPQAEVHFRWVMRNVMFYEQTDTWIPPAFTLRRGYGGALDRALVFLALLRQSRLEGCLIVLPDSDPLQFLVAVLDPKTANLHLFDTRLGLALRSKDRKSILTLKEALDDPTLLQPAKIAPAQVKNLEAWLACPLDALAPRMLELQIGLSAHDAITLHMNAAWLHQEIGKATKLPGKVWNSPADGKVIPNSPTRCLNLFLPKQDGGHDETKRAEQVARAQIPTVNVLTNFAQINVNADLLPRPIYQLLMRITEDFFAKYDLQMREMYLRGRYESMIRRQERLQAFAKNDALIGLVGDKAFETELAEWRKRVSEANAVLANDRADPQTRALAQQILQGFGSQDAFLAWLVQLDIEDKLGVEQKPAVLTKILAVGMRDYFDFELARAQASANHEKAACLQASLDAAAKSTKSAQAKTQDAWSVAQSSWSNFYLQRIVLAGTIEQRLEQIRRIERMDAQRADVLRYLEAFDMKVSLLENLHLEVHKYFQAKQRLAECKVHLEGEKKAKAYLEDVQREIEQLQKKAPLQTEVKNLGDGLQRFVQAQRLPEAVRAVFQKRLDLLARDWSENGAYAWMKRGIGNQ